MRRRLEATRGAGALLILVTFLSASLFGTVPEDARANPGIDANGPYGGPDTCVGTPIVFVVTTDDPSLLLFRWDFDYDGIFDLPGQAGCGDVGCWTLNTSVTYTYYSPYSGLLTVEGWDGVSTQTIVIDGVPHVVPLAESDTATVEVVPCDGISRSAGAFDPYPVLEEMRERLLNASAPRSLIALIDQVERHFFRMRLEPAHRTLERMQAALSRSRLDTQLRDDLIDTSSQLQSDTTPIEADFQQVGQNLDVALRLLRDSDGVRPNRLRHFEHEIGHARLELEEGDFESAVQIIADLVGHFLRAVYADQMDIETFVTVADEILELPQAPPVEFPEDPVPEPACQGDFDFLVSLWYYKTVIYRPPCGNYETREEYRRDIVNRKRAVGDTLTDLRKGTFVRLDVSGGCSCEGCPCEATITWSIEPGKPFSGSGWTGDGDSRTFYSEATGSYTVTVTMVCTAPGCLPCEVKKTFIVSWDS